MQIYDWQFEVRRSGDRTQLPTEKEIEEMKESLREQIVKRVLENIEFKVSDSPVTTYDVVARLRVPGEHNT